MDVAVVVVAVVVTDATVGLSGVAFMVVFGFESGKCPDGIIAPL